MAELTSEYKIILEALSNAASQDSNLIKAAEHVLKCLETQKSYYSVLLSIACDPSYEVFLRLTAILCFKNGIDRFWRKTAPNAIEDDEKDFIRQKLLTCFNEPIGPIAIQFGVVISKVARYDFPADWPQLMPIILELSRPNGDHPYAALYNLKLIAKSLASKCIKPERRKFQQLTASIFPNLVTKWNMTSTTVLTCGVENLNSVAEYLKASIVLLKIMKILVVDGFENASDDPHANTFINLLFNQIKEFIQYRYTLKCCSTQFDSAVVQNLLEAFEKYIVLHVKIISSLFDVYENHFDDFVTPTLKLCAVFLLTENSQEFLFERLTVHLFNLLKKTFTPQNAGKRSTSFNAVVSEFFCQEGLQYRLCEQMLDTYLVLSQEEVENWIADPEAFAAEEATETWQYNLRPCAESFFSSLFQYCPKTTLLPVLIEKIRTVQNTPLPKDAPGIWKRDAVYNAAGLTVFRLFNEIDFNEWFEILLLELKEDIPLSPILHRRIIWLFGQWVGVDMKADNRPRLFEVVSRCLGPEENLLVRLAAADTLRKSIDDFDFHENQLLPYIDASLAGLFQLLEELKECDLMMTILQTMTILIEMMEESIRNYQNAFQRCLPRLWEGSAQHNMMRCAVVTCATRLVQAIYSMSESWQPFLVPVVCFCVDLNEPAHVYLLEDGMALWKHLLRNAPVPNDLLLQAARLIFPIIETRYELLGTSCEIVTTYIALAPEAFLRSYGENLIHSLFEIACDIKDEGINHLSEVVTSVFLASPVDGPVFFEKFMDIILEKMLEKSEACFQYCVTLLCRVIFANVDSFARIVRKRAVQTNSDTSDILEQFVDLAGKRIHYMACDKKRKMVALGLITLLNTREPVVLCQICRILLAVMGVLHDVTLAVAPGEKDTKLDCLVIPPDQPVSRAIFSDCNTDDCGTEHDLRIKEMARVDPVHKVVLKEYLGLQMAALEKSIGAEKFQELMNTVDFETKQQIAAYLDPVDALCNQLNTHTIE